MRNMKAKLTVPTPVANCVPMRRVRSQILRCDLATYGVLGCLIWSFIDGHLCRELRSYGVRSERTPDAVSAYMVTSRQRSTKATCICDCFLAAEAPECDKERIEDEAKPLQIAQAHHPECASVLVHGPGEKRRTCADRDEANQIFVQEVKRIRLHF